MVAKHLQSKKEISMNIRFLFLATTGAGLFALAPPATGAAPAATEVVRVSNCVASPARPEASYMGPFNKMVLQPGLPAMAMIDFANASSAPISSVEFGLVADDRLLAVVRDMGSFAPNVRIMHAYGIADAAVPPAGARPECVPLRVRYADGITWVNPSMPAH
jgi:hypothetical protein